MVAVAQLVEPRIVVPNVAGSCPVRYPIWRNTQVAEEISLEN